MEEEEVAISPRPKGKGRIRGILNPVERLDPGDRDTSSVIHHGYACSSPVCPFSGQPIQGTRFECVDCYRNFCSECAGNDQNQHDISHQYFECQERLTVLEIKNGSPRRSRFDRVGWEEHIILNEHTVNETSSSVHDFDWIQTLVQGIPSHRPDPQLIEQPIHVEHHPQAVLQERLGLEQLLKYRYEDSQFSSYDGCSPAIARLLELQPGEPGDKIECRFRLTHFKDPLSYQVVCFKWKELQTSSNSNGSVEASVDKRRHSVRVGNYHFLDTSAEILEALQALRRPTEVVSLWIDDLCFDKNHARRFQNRARGLIFNHASQAIMHAGEANDDSENVCSLIVRLSFYCQGEEFVLPSSEEIQKDPEFSPLDSEEWESFFRFFTRTIVETEWQFEDIAFANDAVMHYGGAVFQWTDITAILRMLAQDSWKEYLSD